MEKNIAEKSNLEGKVEKSVLYGKDGWLFLYSGAEKQFSYLSLEGMVPTKESVINFESNIMKRMHASKEIGAKYLHLPLPSKPLCAEDKLPDKYAGNIGSIFNRFYAPFLSGGVKDCIFYPLSIVRERNFFRKLDTHMNEDGNFFVSTLVLSRFGIVPAGLENYKITSMRMSGDLGVMLGNRMVSSEPHYERLGDPLLSYTNKEDLPSNTNHIMAIHNPEDTSGRNLLISGDSFALWLLRFLAPSFANTVYVRGPEFPYEFLPIFKPSHVISSNTERYLAKQSADGRKLSPILQMLHLEGVSPNRRFMKTLQALSSRAYAPTHYVEWEYKTRRKIVFSKTLGAGRAEGMMITETPKEYHLSQNTERSGYRFNNAKFDNHKKYTVTVRLNSSMSGTLKLFYTTWRPNEQSFEAERMLSSDITKGENVVNFRIPVSLVARLVKFQVYPSDVCYFIESAEAKEQTT